MTEAVRILVVCTANICRSVMAETYLRVEAEERGLPIEVGSSGFLRNGEPASDAVTTVMGERGFDVSHHRSRITTPKIVDGVDLVVTMERAHGRRVAAMGRARGVLTMVRATDLLGEVDPSIADPVERIAVADSARAEGDLLDTGPDEIDDPFGTSLEINRATADRLRALSAGLLDGLFG